MEEILQRQIELVKSKEKENATLRKIIQDRDTALEHATAQYRRDIDNHRLEYRKFQRLYNIDMDEKKEQLKGRDMAVELLQNERDQLKDETRDLRHKLHYAKRLLEKKDRKRRRLKEELAEVSYNCSHYHETLRRRHRRESRRSSRSTSQPEAGRSHASRPYRRHRSLPGTNGWRGTGSESAVYPERGAYHSSTSSSSNRRNR